MTIRIMMTRVAPALVAGLIAACALPVHKAQAQASLPSPTSVGPVVKGGSGIAAPQPSVAGLPGARSTTPVNKGIVSSALLSPNDELFDAIDRGDMNAARDAVARGADLSATDAVGQTPIDESVSLGRNNITFLLVTLLHANGSQITDAQGPMAMPPPNTLGLSSKDQKISAAPVSFFSPAAPAVRRHTKNRYASTQSGAEMPPAPAVGAPSGADSSGTPIPSAGFVGFGASGQ